MTIRSTIVLPAMVLAALLSAGCGGGESKLEATTTTMGQELSDLKKAYDQGIITEQQYEKSKQNILDRYE